jgi:hypothetical protein
VSELFIVVLPQASAVWVSLVERAEADQLLHPRRHLPNRIQWYGERVRLFGHEEARIVWHGDDTALHIGGHVRASTVNKLAAIE